mgnify:CR=1 FL=1
MLILYLITILLYYFRPSWIFLLWLITEPILAPVMTLYMGITGYDDTASFIYPLIQGYSRVFLLICLFLIAVKRKIPQSSVKSFIFPWAILLVYLILHSIFIHFDLLIIYGNAFPPLYSSVPLFLFLLDKRTRPSYKHLYWVIMFIYIVELIWIPMNLNGIYAYVGRYEVFFNDPQESVLMPGTFLRSNNLADFVAITFFFVMIHYFEKKCLPKWLFCLTTIIAVVLLFCAGSKTPILCVFLSFVLIIFEYRRIKAKHVLSLIAFVITVFFISENVVLKKDLSNEGAKRVIGELSDLSKSKLGSKFDNTTFGLSFILIDKYFYDSPLIGCGDSYKGDKAYKLGSYVEGLEYAKADATFAFYLVEFGIIGLFLYLFYYFRLLKYAVAFHEGNSKKLIIPVYVFFLLFSFTEGGIFVVINFWFILIYIFANNCPENVGKNTF